MSFRCLYFCLAKTVPLFSAFVSKSKERICWQTTCSWGLYLFEDRHACIALKANCQSSPLVNWIQILGHAAQHYREETLATVPIKMYELGIFVSLNQKQGIHEFEASIYIYHCTQGSYTFLLKYSHDFSWPYIFFETFACKVTWNIFKTHVKPVQKYMYCIWKLGLTAGSYMAVREHYLKKLACVLTWLEETCKWELASPVISGHSTPNESLSWWWTRGKHCSRQWVSWSSPG